MLIFFATEELATEELATEELATEELATEELEFAFWSWSFGCDSRILIVGEEKENP
mgnify:CR=1 FL=1